MNVWRRPRVPAYDNGNVGQDHANATGFTQFEFGISAKWLEVLKHN
jgi:hypothetical protein